MGGWLSFGRRTFEARILIRLPSPEFLVNVEMPVYCHILYVAWLGRNDVCIPYSKYNGSTLIANSFDQDLNLVHRVQAIFVFLIILH